MPAGTFSLGKDSEPLGVVWALAGSSLGNAMILKSLVQSTYAASFPTAFLSDTSMHGFWKSLLPTLRQVPGEAMSDAACDAAVAVFDHFQRTAQACQERLAA